ncbi:hypothetical protein [Nocardia sp. SSK8]|uniref:hypothetical protein n=1 Tax=Nocardia sp. SSK8 TaxID=3120154 RepID=UPI003008AE95
MTAGAGSKPDSALRGVVGDRQLFAVQTFDIARLTSHVVPLVPRTFVAVSGQGPKMDSNGSGKTSFLIAVSVLLADPQWRLDVYGGKNAAGVLFKPDSAGLDPVQQIRPSTVGYIAGVFAREDDPAKSVKTVWVRLSTSAPYLQVRWISGVHLANSDEDGIRELQADDLWEAAKGNGTCSARRMAETLYGDAPRCLSYLDTPLRPPVPSLLSQQMTEMGPREIAESLIALSGSRTLLEQEQTERGVVVDRQKNYDEALEDQKRQYLLDENELVNISARDNARAQLDQAQQHWHYYSAVRYLDVLERDRDLEQRWRTAVGLRAESAEELRRAELELAQLNAENDLDRAEQDARINWKRTGERLRDLESARSTLVGQRQVLELRLRELIDASKDWAGETAEEAALAVDRAFESFAEARLRGDRNKDRLQELEQQLKRAEEGRIGKAGHVIDLLEQAGIAGAALFDIVEVLPAARLRWEGRLWPWQDAVVVDHDQLVDARRAVADLPGAMLVATDDHGHHTDIDGAHSSRPISDFLGVLADRWRDVDDRGLAFITDEPARATIFAGFPSPITGRAAVVCDLRSRVRKATDDAARSQQALVLAQAEHELAEAALRGAKAAADLKEVQESVAEINEQVGEIAGKIGKAVEEEAGLEAVWRNRLADKEGHDLRVQAVQGVYREKKADDDQASSKLASLENERIGLQVERWRALWGGDEHSAQLVRESEPSRSAREAHAEVLRCVADAARAYGIEDGAESTTGELADTARLRREFARSDALAFPTVVLEDLAAPLQVRLEGHLGRDRSTRARIEQDREQKALLVQNAETELALASDRLMTLQDMIERHLESILRGVSTAFDRLDRERGGFGAELTFNSERPSGPGDWTWQATPRWRRSRSGPLVSYRQIANGAQVKVYAVQLVLAAVLADSHTAGKVLVLDELGNSLGEVNRKDVLGALKAVAEEAAVTILGTCQDSVLVDAADICGELMWFEHANSSDAFNQPTRAWGYDANGERVDAIHSWLEAGRADE